MCIGSWFALNHDKSLQIDFFCVKRLANNDFLKDVESTVERGNKIIREWYHFWSHFSYVFNPLPHILKSKQEHFTTSWYFEVSFVVIFTHTER